MSAAGLLFLLGLASLAAARFYPAGQLPTYLSTGNMNTFCCRLTAHVMGAKSLGNGTAEQVMMNGLVYRMFYGVTLATPDSDSVPDFPIPTQTPLNPTDFFGILDYPDQQSYYSGAYSSSATNYATNTTTMQPLLSRMAKFYGGLLGCINIPTATRYSLPTSATGQRTVHSAMQLNTTHLVAMYNAFGNAMISYGVTVDFTSTAASTDDGYLDALWGYFNPGVTNVDQIFINGSAASPVFEITMSNQSFISGWDGGSTAYVPYNATIHWNLNPGLIIAQSVAANSLELYPGGFMSNGNPTFLYTAPNFTTTLYYYSNFSTNVTLYGVINVIPELACTSSPCLNGATCQETGTSYTCVCASRFTGTRCESCKINYLGTGCALCNTGYDAAVNCSRCLTGFALNSATGLCTNCASGYVGQYCESVAAAETAAAQAGRKLRKIITHTTPCVTVGSTPGQVTNYSHGVCAKVGSASVRYYCDLPKATNISFLNYNTPDCSGEVISSAIFSDNECTSFLYGVGFSLQCSPAVALSSLALLPLIFSLAIVHVMFLFS